MVGVIRGANYIIEIERGEWREMGLQRGSRKRAGWIEWKSKAY